MNDSIEIVMSWIVMFIVALFVVVTGETFGEVNKIDSFHAQVNPIIEEYGGDSNVPENHFVPGSSHTETAQKQIEQVAYRMLSNNHVAFVVTPDTKEANNDFPQKVNYTGHIGQASTKQDLKNYVQGAIDNTDELHGSSGNQSSYDKVVAPYGHEINYEIHIVTPYNLGPKMVSHVINSTSKFSTVSKVGTEH